MKKINIRLEFGRRLAAARRKAGHTQYTLARRMRINSAQISHYEQGISLPSLPVIVEMSLALGVSLDSLVGRRPLRITKPTRDEESKLPKQARTQTEANVPPGPVEEPPGPLDRLSIPDFKTWTLDMD